MLKPLQAARICYLPLVLLAALADAAPELEVSVTREGPYIVSTADFIVDRPHHRVVEAFTAFGDLARLNPAILASHAEPTADGRVLVTTRLHACIALFCRTVTLVEHVKVDANDTIRSEIVPERGDFAAGHATWTFEARDEQTYVSYRGRLKPDFWLPPLVGRHAWQAALRRQIEALMGHLESHSTPGPATQCF